MIFEAPHRVAETLADMADVLGERPGAIARELTKLHEDIVRGSLRTLAEATIGETLKGEIVLVIGPGEAQPVSDETISARLGEVLQGMSLKDAAKSMASNSTSRRPRLCALA